MKNTNTLANIIVENNRYATVKLNAEQISAENLNKWVALCKSLHKSAYVAYVQCENNGCKAEDTSIDKSAIYANFRNILAFIGEVNGHKMYANEETAITMIAYSGRRANVDAPELQFARSKKSLSESMLRKATNPDTGLPIGGQEQYCTNLRADIAKSNDEIATLVATADMRIKAPTRTSDNAFRLELEHYLARAINGQLAKTWDELEAEVEARKKARNEKLAKRRAEKKAENK